MEQDKVRQCLKLIQTSNDKKTIENASEVIIRLHDKLIHKLISEFGNERIDYDDLYQESVLAVLRATRSYDFTSKAKFSSFAYTAIKNALRRYTSLNIESVKTPEKFLTFKIMKNYSDVYVRPYKRSDANARVVGPVQENDVITKDLAADIKSALSELTEDERTAAIIYMNSPKHHFVEICKEMDIELKVAHKLIRDAFNKLRKKEILKRWLD